MFSALLFAAQTVHCARVFIERTTHIPASLEICLAENDFFFIFFQIDLSSARASSITRCIESFEEMRCRLR
jgi:hypothetical protein